MQSRKDPKEKRDQFKQSGTAGEKQMTIIFIFDTYYILHKI